MKEILILLAWIAWCLFIDRVLFKRRRTFPIPFYKFCPECDTGYRGSAKEKLCPICADPVLKAKRRPWPRR